MPARHSRRDDPFHSINSWDDGFEYIRPDLASPPPRGRSSDPYFAPPPLTRPSRPPAYESAPLPRPPLGRDVDPSPRPRYRSPGPIGDDFGPPRRHRREPSPGANRFSRSPSPIRRRDDRQQKAAHYPPPAAHGRPRPPAYAAEPSNPPLRRHTTREPRPRAYSVSPPPMPRRRAATYSRSPSPRRARGYDQDPRERNRAYDRYDRDRRRAPSPPPAVSGSKRPPLARSNSTKERLSHLSPRWQQAAVAALQAGGMAALNMRSEPGAWKGQKGAKVATAALGTAAADAFAKGGKKGGGKKKSGLEGIGGALGGLIIDQLGKSGSGSGKRR